MWNKRLKVRAPVKIPTHPPKTSHIFHKNELILIGKVNKIELNTWYTITCFRKGLPFISRKQVTANPAQANDPLWLDFILLRGNLDYCLWENGWPECVRKKDFIIVTWRGIIVVFMSTVLNWVFCESSFDFNNTWNIFGVCF